MTETVSVRIDKEDIEEIDKLSKLENKTKSSLLREILELGLKDKKLELALEKFRNKEASIGKAARIAEMPLSQFMDVLVQKNIEFHYGIKELEEDFEGLI